MKRAAVLWTGGKDSFLALLAVKQSVLVERLVTMVPDPPRPFLAHPLECMRAQADALGIPHEAVPIGEPVKEAYERAIEALAAEGIDVLVTGDMDRIEGHDSWVVERARGLVEVVRPLWGSDRADILERLLELRVRVVCMLARDREFGASGVLGERNDGLCGIVGREFDRSLVDELIARHGCDGFDACGENGEYHTCVLDGPGFRGPLHLVGATVRTAEGFRHLDFESVELR